MTRVGWALGKIPGIPSYRSRGKKRLRKALADYYSRFDADMIAMVRSDIGWDFEPVRRHSIDGQTWAEPLDSDGPWYPADGVPEDPPELWGVPVALGYRDFGCLPEVPNTEVYESPTQAGQSTLAYRRAGDDDGRDRPDTDTVIEDVEQTLERLDEPGQPPGGAASPFETRDSGDADDGGDDDGDDTGGRWQSWRDGVAAWLRRHRARAGLRMMQAGTTALIVKQDGDAVLTCKPATYEADGEGPQWYVTDDKAKKYDAREAGSGPLSLHDADIGVAFGPVPKLIAPVLPRIARNIHSLRVADNPPQPATADGDEGTDAGETADAPSADGTTNGTAVPVSDGGTIRHNDIIVEERALVWPADIKLLGGEYETQDHLDTLAEQVRAMANPPGGEWLQRAGKLGGVVLGFILGVVLGDPSGLIELIGGAL